MEQAYTMMDYLTGSYCEIIPSFWTHLSLLLTHLHKTLKCNINEKIIQSKQTTFEKTFLIQQALLSYGFCCLACMPVNDLNNGGASVVYMLRSGISIIDYLNILEVLLHRSTGNQYKFAG